MRKLYRIFTDLAYGKQVIRAGGLAVLDLPPRTEIRLIEREHIAVASGPPLAMLPGWKERVRALRKLKILDVTQLIEADAGQIAGVSGVSADEVATWQTEAMEWLKPRNIE